MLIIDVVIFGQFSVERDTGYLRTSGVGGVRREVREVPVCAVGGCDFQVRQAVWRSGRKTSVKLNLLGIICLLR